MLGTALVVGGLLKAGESYMGYKAGAEQAKAKGKAAKRHAEYLRLKNIMNQQIAREKMESEIAMKKERLEHETDYIIEQLEKQEAKIVSGATAGYAASGIGGGSAEAVLRRIEGEYESKQDVVTETAELELSQYEESKQQAFDWFVTQSDFETQYGIQSDLDAASAYQSQEEYSSLGMLFGPAAQLGQSALLYGMYGSTPSKKSDSLNIQ